MAEKYWVVLAACLSIPILVLLEAYTRSLTRRRASLFQIAMEHEGRILPAGLGVRWRMEVNIDGVVAEVFAGSQESQDRWGTWFSAAWRPPGRLHLARDGILARVGKWLDGQDIQVGDAGFDRAYWIFGKPEAWVREVLDAALRDRISKYSEHHRHDLRIDIGSEGLRIGAPRDLTESDGALREMIEVSIALMRRCRAVSAGLAALPSAEEVIAAGKCPVCAQPLAEPLHRCARCRTAHHRECWEYFGACAIYGCARGPALAPPSDGKPG